MKAGVILVAAAIALFFATVLWSFRQPVKLDWTPRTEQPALPVVRETANSFFYDAGQAISCRVTVPAHVILDEQFSGVEITGDTSLSKRLKVHNLQSTYGKKASTQLYIGLADTMSGSEWYNRSFEKYKGLMGRIDSADITVRIGLKPDPAKKTDRILDFRYCKSVTSVTNISAKKLDLAVGRDTTNLTLDTRTLMLTASNPFSRLKGRTYRANYYVQKAHLDAKNLIAREVYYQGSYDSYLDMFASDIVHGYSNYGVVPDINISGNPPYQRID